MTPAERAEVRRDHLEQDAREARETDLDYARHEAHEGEYAVPESCWICRETLETFLRFGETLPDRAWRQNAAGYVTLPLQNRGTP